MYMKLCRFPKLQHIFNLIRPSDNLLKDEVTQVTLKNTCSLYTAIFVTPPPQFNKFMGSELNNYEHNTMRLVYPTLLCQCRNCYKHFHYVAILTLPKSLNPWPRSDEILKFGRGLYGHHDRALPSHAMDVEKKMFQD